jgi:protein-disulfide isomerase
VSAGPGRGEGAGPNRRTQLLVLAGFAAVILIAAIVISVAGSDDESSDGGEASSADTALVEQTLDGIPQEGVLLGEPDAPETIVEFVDLQCPFCAEFSTEAFPEFVDRFVRPGDVNYELRVISFLGADSGEAAEMAAAAALQNRLFDFTEVFYLNQGEENSGYVTDEFLTEIGEQTPGLEVDAALEERSSPEVQSLIDENEATAEEFGVNSTPTFYLVTADGEQTELVPSDLTAEALADALEAARSRG